MVLTIIMFSFTIITNPVFNEAIAQGQQYSFTAKWEPEIEPRDIGKFRHHLDIGIDPNNNVYVTDTQAYLIAVLLPQIHG